MGTESHIPFLQKLFWVLTISLFLLGLLSSSAPIILHDMSFNTDIARDFLLLEQTVQTHKLPLIGPRSGGISGIFHGPLWLYLNLPAYVIGRGDPLVVGYFWIFLEVLTSGIIFWVGKKLFDQYTGAMAAVIFMLVQIDSLSALFNPFGATMVFPLFFYLLVRYLQNKQFRYLISALFLCGLMIQFQIAFGGPILFLSSLIILAVILRTRKFSHLLAYLILLIPFSTYILFDLRHQFLELHSLISYAHGATGSVKGFDTKSFMSNRYDSLTNAIAFIAYTPWYSHLIATIFFFFVLLFAWRTPEKGREVEYRLFVYLFLGYFALTYLYRGVVWSYYYAPFVPVTALVLLSIRKYVASIFFWIAIIIAVYPLAIYDLNVHAVPTSVGYDTGSWLFNEHVAEKVFGDNEKEFGYYIFSPDEYGYSPRYAMHFIATKHPLQKADAYMKKPITYLLISPPGGKSNGIQGDWWVINKVHITKQPIQTWTFPNGFRVEKYALDASDISVPSDPNMITDLSFR